MVITIIVLPIFVLPTAVICVQTEVGFSEAVVLEVMVQEGNDAISTLPYVNPLVYEVIDLYNESECHPWGKKVQYYESIHQLACRDTASQHTPKVLSMLWTVRDVDL